MTATDPIPWWGVAKNPCGAVANTDNPRPCVCGLPSEDVHEIHLCREPSDRDNDLPCNTRWRSTASDYSLNDCVLSPGQGPTLVDIWCPSCDQTFDTNSEFLQHRRKALDELLTATRDDERDKVVDFLRAEAEGYSPLDEDWYESVLLERLAERVENGAHAVEAPAAERKVGA